MSLLRVECGHCHAVLQVRAELAGHQGRCPKCASVVDIPSQGAAHEASAPWESFPDLPGEADTIKGAGSSGAARSAPQPPPDAPPSTKIIQSPPYPPPVMPLHTASSSLASAAGATPLSHAMAPDMMAELARRRKSAVLVVFETPIGDSYDISRQTDANVRCYRTGDMTDAQLMQVLNELGRMTQGQRNQKGGVGLRPDTDLLSFELKGDRLGMSLLEFKKKYSRLLGGLTLPYTSESFAGQSNATLWSEPWHASAGIVHARIELPSENNSPTIAGVKTDLFLYHFVDGRLYRITALFDTEAFHVVRAALVDKYGPPTNEVKDPMELAWENPVSTIRLVRGMMRPKKSSTLLVIHHELQSLAESRVPRRDSDL